MMHSNRLLILGSLTLLFFSACKKNDTMVESTNLVPSVPDTSSATSPTSMAVLNQVAFDKTKDYYLWSNLLPATYNAASFTDPAAVMTDIRQYSRETGFQGAVDRWSFAMKKTEWEELSGGISTLATTSTEGDFGLEALFRVEGDLRVKKVEPSSPAGLAGIHRGWRITKVNGNTNIATTNAAFLVDNIYYSTSSSFTFLKPDGSSVDINLAAGHYTAKPLYLDTVYNTAAGKVGYFIYNSFLGDINQATLGYGRVFSHFADEGITNLVVDLRYNGGGYVDLQEKLANYLINNSAGSGLMMQQIYNAAHTSENTTSYFRKTGSLNLPKIYFIVSRGTASASELLINNLKPYMDVRIIGPSNTHGKPVGFFPIANGEWYVFPVSFKTLNKNGDGNYYAGFTPNAQVADGVDKDWGNVNEASLASALRNITSGSYRGNNNFEIYEEPVSVAAGNEALDKVNLKVTVGYKRF